MTIVIIAAMCVVGVVALAFQVIEPLVEPSSETRPAHRRRHGGSAHYGVLRLP